MKIITAILKAKEKRISRDGGNQLWSLELLDG